MRRIFFVGFGVGVAFGVLAAPKPGSELREQMRQFAEDARRVLENGRERLQPVIEKVRHNAELTGRKARELNEPVLNEVRQRVGALNSQASSVADRLVRQHGSETDLDRDRVLSILNDWPQERLMKIDGIGPVLASKIIRHRPYRSEEEFIDSKDFPPSAIESLRKAA